MQTPELTSIQQSIFSTLQLCKYGVTRDQLCELCHMSRTTVYYNLVKLEELNLVKHYKKKVHNGPGGPIIIWEVVDH